MTGRECLTPSGPGNLSKLAIRPLGDLEKLFWATSVESNVNWVQSARISGKLNPAELQQALDAVQQRHPLLSVCVELDHHHVPHFTSHAPCPIPLRVAARKDDVSWLEEAEAEINKPMDPSQPPLLRAVLVQGQQISEILLCGQHCNCDGISIISLVRDLMRALAKLPAAPNLPMRPPFEELFLPLRAAAEHARCSDTPLPPPGESLTRPKDTSQADGDVSPYFKVWVWQLDRDQTNRLIESCRKREVTVHSAICAAFLSSFGKLSQNSPDHSVCCASPINLRNACPPVEDDFGVYISMLVSFHQLDQTRDFWALARSVKEQLNQAKQPQNIVAAHIALRDKVKLSSAKAIVEWSRRAVFYEFGVSNLGRLPIPSTFGSLKITHLWPPIAVSNPLADTVVVFTFEDKLNVTITSAADRRQFGSLAIECLNDLN